MKEGNCMKSIHFSTLVHNVTDTLVPPQNAPARLTPFSGFVLGMADLLGVVNTRCPILLSKSGVPTASLLRPYCPGV